MSEIDPALVDARVRAEAARVEFRGALDEAMAWLTPARIKAEAAIAATHQIDEAKQALRRQVRSHPLVVWAGFTATAALGLFLVRQPIASLARIATRTILNLYHSLARRVA